VGNNLPLRKSANWFYLWGPGIPAPSNGVENAAYILSVPQKTVSYSINVVQPNRPPTPPVINGPITGYKDENQSFSFYSTDPDGDKIKYQVDWNIDQTPDENNPNTWYVDSGTWRTSSKTWVTTGTKTFLVRAVDKNGSPSSWVPYAVAISLKPVNGLCGTALNVCTTGTFSDIADTTSQQRWSCDGANGGVNASCALNKAQCSITFNKNAPDATGTTAPQSFYSGQNKNLSTNNFDRTGHVFAGWNTNSGGTGTGYSNNAQYSMPDPCIDRILYAQWTPNTYPITYNGNGNTSGIAPANQNKTHGVNINLRTNSGNLAKNGHTFAGWNTNTSGT
jgi:uncharacterized repeat protein (TIGR02543 family)